MPNPLFNALGGNMQNPMLSQFTKFMQSMKGQDPNKIIDDMVSSGRLTQEQLNMVQQRAQQMSGTFDQLKSMFNF